MSRIADGPRAATVARVNGPLVEIEGLSGVAAYDVVRIGGAGLVGEIVALRDGVATAQIYEYTGGIAPGDPVVSDRFPLAAELGPGLIGGIFDGTLRRLDRTGLWLEREAAGDEPRAEALWSFQPLAEAAGAEVHPGDPLGTVPEGTVTHRILVPPGVEGRLEWLAPAGDLGFADRVAVVSGRAVTLGQRWPVRRPRPVALRLPAKKPLLTGQRVVDLLYPLALGSTAAVPGGFGTGKTLLLQQIAKWCAADIIVYVGCGERGNEMTDVVRDLSSLEDPRTGRPLRERTVVIANTSNMPVMAREASIHSGATVAEYFRDMGYDVVLIADSTSRWAEALREFASRTDELPTEEGYPASLSSALAAFYERAGRVRTLGGREGSLTIIGAVSPPGGDMTDPVTAHTRRYTRCVWSLDRDLAYARHYPAVSWRASFARDTAAVGDHRASGGDPGWSARTSRALELLAEADRLEPLVELMGVTALPDRERVTRRAAALLRDAVLRQSATSPNDAYCSEAKQQALLEMVLQIYDRLLELCAAGLAAARIEEIDLSAAVGAAEAGPADDAASVHRVEAEVLAMLGGIG